MNRDEIMALSSIRFQKALATLESAKHDINEDDYLSANNRVYYAMYYAIRSVTILKGFDSKKHDKILGFFNREIVANAIISKDYGKIINKIKRVREKNDYDDFYIIDKEDTAKNLESVEKLIFEIKGLIEKAKESNNGFLIQETEVTYVP